MIEIKKYFNFIFIMLKTIIKPKKQKEYLYITISY